MNKLVFDVGGTAVKYAIMDNDANILSKGSYPTPMESKEAFIASLANLFQENMDDVDGIAMSLPGGIDSDRGYVYNAGALAFNANCHLSKEIEEAVKALTEKEIHVSIENDGKSAALAEVWKGNLQDVDNGVVIILGTGIGGGIIHNKRVLKGNNFFAGELSFVATDCTKPGFSKALAMEASAISLVKKVADAKGVDHKEMDGFKVFELLENKDSQAWEVFDGVCNTLAGTIYNLECILNPDKVLIGGGISKQPLVLDTIKEKAYGYFDAITSMGIPMPKPEIDVCRHFNDSNLIGALYNYNLVYGQKA